jgi:hypothetical protein
MRNPKQTESNKGSWERYLQRYLVAAARKCIILKYQPSASTKQLTMHKVESTPQPVW